MADSLGTHDAPIVISDSDDEDGSTATLKSLAPYMYTSVLPPHARRASGRHVSQHIGASNTDHQQRTPSSERSNDSVRGSTAHQTTKPSLESRLTGSSDLE